MNIRSGLNGLCVIALAAGCPTASADQQPGSQPQQNTDDSRAKPSPKQDANPTTAGQPREGEAASTPDQKPTKNASVEQTDSKLDTAQAMKLSRDAMTHIAAAEKALKDGKTSAAKSALARSKQALSKLYDAPALAAVLNEFDEALGALAGKKPALEAMDLAPLSATVSSYQEYLDPAVAAGVKQAQARAREGDAKGTEEALRLARNRVEIEVALLPVEEAYVRVLAAQQSLQSGNTKEAARLLRNVPIVISEVQISRPLVPIRFKLQAAAEAAEAQDWSRSRELLDEAGRDVQRLDSHGMNLP
jgi:hypothetical protein